MVALNLFGTMSSSNHVNLVQDLHARYLTAKLKSFTEAQKIIQASKEKYSSYGKPDTQLFDEEPPFNFKQLHRFTRKNSIKLHKISINTTSIIKFC